MSLDKPARSWSDPGSDPLGDMRAMLKAWHEDRLGYRDTEFYCSFGHRLVICEGAQALNEHVKEAHPDVAREWGLLPKEET